MTSDTTRSNSERPLVLAGICGGIAAYKAVDVVSRLRKAGCDVHVAMTEAAQQFVTPLTFAAVSGHAVLRAQFPSADVQNSEALYPHLYPSTRADAFLLLPATADMMAMVAHGMGRDIVSTSALSLPSSCRRIFCPAMNVEMWNQPVVQANVERMEKAGWIRIGPDAGLLACGMEGEGRMAEPEEITRRVADIMARGRRLQDLRVLIISGPTREHIDPVRFIGNPSSGKMGQALAEEALAAGAEVEFVTGPVPEAHMPRGARLHVKRVLSAREMLDAAQALYDRADVVVYAAAVADYMPAEFHDQKLPKHDGEMTLKLIATPDIAATLNTRKRDKQVVIGFALQSHDGAREARAKLEKKRFDGIVLNSLDALGGDTGSYRYLAARNGHREFVDWGTLDKHECARRILDEALSALQR